MSCRSGRWARAGAIHRAALFAGLVFLLAAPVAGGVEWDREIRCCFKEPELKDAFVISLEGVGHPVGQLKVVTPSGGVVGYDEREKKFHQPGKYGVYALGPHPNTPIDAPHWNRARYLVLRKQWHMGSGWEALLYRGRFRVMVVGLFPGSYVLRLSPGGIDDPRARVVFGDAEGVRIQPGDVHAYEFDAEPFRISYSRRG